MRTILVVDDEPPILQLIANVLGARGYSILLAASGPLGISTARAHPGEIHLLVSDFNMPGMNGVELASTLRQERPALKVMLMSGAPPETMPDAWFLPKPFRVDRLATMVWRLAG